MEYNTIKIKELVILFSIVEYQVRIKISHLFQVEVFKKPTKDGWLWKVTTP